MLRYARDGDTIAATNLDRLRRTLRECLNALHDLRQQGLGITTLKDPLPIDTTDNSPLAELAVALLALFAHLERVFLHQRATHTRDTAATHDKQPGRPRKLNPHQLAATRAALAANQSIEHVAAAFGISRATLYHHLTQHNN